jgi:NAD(P)-dependent dehydrogenase (short-subunit alcohol dehydrogenase family)
VTIGGDIADPDTAQRVVDDAVERFGRIDTLINNAGIYIGKPFTDYTLQDFNALIAVNLAGFFHMTTRTIRHMLDQGRGHVVNVSTTLVEHADSSRPAALQTLTKGGLVAVTRSLAVEYASRGLRMNAISRRYVARAAAQPGRRRGRQAFESSRSPHPAANSDGPPPVCQNTTGPSMRPARASAIRPAIPLAL